MKRYLFLLFLLSFITINAKVTTSLEIKMDGDQPPSPWSDLWYDCMSVFFRVEYLLSKKWLVDVEFERPLFYLYLTNSYNKRRNRLSY